MKRLLILVVGITIAFYGCNFKEKRAKEVKLTIVETSDVHGAIFDYDFISGEKSKGSLSKVQSYLNKINDSTELVLLDNGDILQGQPIVYYYNFENTTDKHICSQVMNFMQYDAATIGNHDIEAGPKVYNKLVQEFNFPWLAANAIDKKSGEPYFQPYVILNKKGVKIAVLGLITPGIPNWLPEELWEGIEFEDMVETAKKWVPEIMKNEKPDVMIGLFHAGYDYTYGNANYETYRNENASVIVAEQVPGFDVIFVGHDHNSWNEKVQNINGDEVLILGPTSGARQVVKAEVNLKLDESGNYKKEIVGDIIEMSSFEADSEFDEIFKNEFNEVNNFVSRKVGEIESGIDAFDAIFGPSAFIDLIHEIQFDVSNADVSFAAPLSFRAKIEKGPIYVSDLFKLYKFENFLYTINLTGEEIDKYLEYSFGNWFNTMKSPNDHLLLFKKDDKGGLLYSERYQSYSLQTNYYNFDVASGIKYTVDLTKPYGDKIIIKSFTDGDIFYEDSVYTVAVNSYRGNGGGGHFTQGVGLTKEELAKRRISSTDKDLRYYMMKWIEEKQVINPTLKNEWTIEPKKWWIVAKENDKKLLK